MRLNNVTVVKGQTHNKKVTVVGVTFNNRQKNLAKLYQKQQKNRPFTVDLQEYLYEGSPAVRVLFDGLDVGVFSSKDAEFYYKNREIITGTSQARVNYFEDAVASKDGEIKTDKSGNPIIESNYTIKLSLVILNVNADIASAPVNYSAPASQNEKPSLFKKLFGKG